MPEEPIEEPIEDTIEEPSAEDVLKQLKETVAKQSAMLAELAQQRTAPPPVQTPPKPIYERIGLSDEEWECFDDSQRKFAEWVAREMAPRNEVIDALNKRDEYFRKNFDPNADKIEKELAAIQKDPDLSVLPPDSQLVLARKRVKERDNSDSPTGFPSTPSPRGNARGPKVTDDVKKRIYEQWLRDTNGNAQLAKEYTERQIKEYQKARGM